MIFHFSPPSKFLQQQVALYSQFSCLSLQKIALLILHPFPIHFHEDGEPFELATIIMLSSLLF